MSGPKRLKDDREFLLAAGLRFEDEAQAMPEWDLGALKARVEAAVAAAPAPGGPVEGGSALQSGGLFGGKIALGVGVAVVAAAGFMGWGVLGGGGAEAAPEPAAVVESVSVPEPAAAPELAGGPAVAATPAVAPAPVEAPAVDAPVVAEAPALAPSPPEPASASNPTPAPNAAAPASRPPVAPSAAAPVAAEAPAPKAPPSDSPAAVGAIEEGQPEIPPAETSTLAAQLALYEAGRAALRAGEFGKAAASFHQYVAGYPEGELVGEAQLSRLEALARGGRAAEAERLATRLLAQGGLAGRRAEVARVRGEQLVKLGRCDEAKAAFVAAGDLSAAQVETALARCEAGAE
ncbi:MAG: hypothetical protein R3F39_18895 [Myxococcota bacterium]